MKKTFLIATSVVFSICAHAQFGNLLKKDKNKDGESSESKSLPKGIEIYTTEHKDAKGVSGKYYMKYPVTLVTANKMNMPKPFNMNEVTVELREDLSGLFHFVNDEPKHQIRYPETDMTKTADMGTGAMNVDVVKKTMAKCNCFRLSVQNSFMPKGNVKQGFKDNAGIYVYTKDPDIILIGSPDISNYKKKGEKRFYVSSEMDFKGGQFNVLSKDKAKLESWDSTKIADALYESELAFSGEVTSAFGELVEMPKQFTDDNEREKEYFNLTQPMAAQDKPVSWGDRMDYVYIIKDWEVKYADAAKTQPRLRLCRIIAVSHGWGEKKECRYIPCIIKQNWEGTAYGKSYFAGFEGALVPVACDKTAAFKH